MNRCESGARFSDDYGIIINMKFRTKFVLFFIALILLLASGMMYYINFYIYKNLKQNALDNFRVIAEISESAYFTFTDLVKTRTIDWGSDGYVRTMTVKMLDAKARGSGEEYQAAAGELGAYLRKEKITYAPDVIITDILDGNGIVVASSREERIGVNEKEEEEASRVNRFSDALRSERSETFISMVVSEADEDTKPMIHAVTRLFSPNKNADGSLVPLDAVLLVHFSNTSTLGEILAGRRQMQEGALTGRALYEYYKTAEVYLVNSRHLMISPSRNGAESILRQRVDTAPVHNCFNNQREIVDEYINYAGKTVIGASMCLVGDQLTLVAEVEKDEILKPLSDVRRALAVSGAVALAVGAVGAAAGSYWLLSPLLAIAGTAEEVARGNLRARAPIKTKDEIGQLAGTFNRMLESVDQSQKKLKESYQKEEALAIDLKQKVAELEKFKRLTVDRELKMVEMKKRIKELGGGDFNY